MSFQQLDFPPRASLMLSTNWWRHRLRCSWLLNCADEHGSIYHLTPEAKRLLVRRHAELGGSELKFESEWGGIIPGNRTREWRAFLIKLLGDARSWEPRDNRGRGPKRPPEGSQRPATALAAEVSDAG